MTTLTEINPTAERAKSKRNRKPKNRLQQRLAAARKVLQSAQEAHEKVLAQLERENTAELARRGRQLYLSTVERMHPGERGLVVAQVLSSVEATDLEAVQTWLDSLDSD